MSYMEVINLGDRLHRLVKLAMDTGEAASLAEAETIFAGYRLAVSVGQDALRSPPHQAALLTIVNTAARSVLGGVEVDGIALDVPLLFPLPGFQTLADAVAGLGARVGSGHRSRRTGRCPGRCCAQYRRPPVRPPRYLRRLVRRRGPRKNRHSVVRGRRDADRRRACWRSRSYGGVSAPAPKQFRRRKARDGFIPLAP
jgi:hypothetical protein